MRILAIAAMLLFAVDGPVRLRTPATVSGHVGGEAHDSYVVHARKGQLLAVRISWLADGENRAQFQVSESGRFADSTPVAFGAESDEGRQWSGVVPDTKDYYIYVVAHPEARYELRVATAR